MTLALLFALPHGKWGPFVEFFQTNLMTKQRLLAGIFDLKCKNEGRGASIVYTDSSFRLAIKGWTISIVLSQDSEFVCVDTRDFKLPWPVLQVLRGNEWMPAFFSPPFPQRWQCFMHLAWIEKRSCPLSPFPILSKTLSFAYSFRISSECKFSVQFPLLMHGPMEEIRSVSKSNFFFYFPNVCLSDVSRVRSELLRNRNSQRIPVLEWIGIRMDEINKIQSKMSGLEPKFLLVLWIGYIYFFLLERTDEDSSSEAGSVVILKGPLARALH